MSELIDYEKYYYNAQHEAVQLADKVDELMVEIKARIAELEAQQWISVEDELPDGPSNVLIAGGCGYYENGQWWSIMGNSSHRPISWEVTHWMPLPEPPA
jgi:hypothetical protein